MEAQVIAGFKKIIEVIAFAAILTAFLSNFYVTSSIRHADRRHGLRAQYLMDFRSIDKSFFHKKSIKDIGAITL